nr:hypothetical protein GOBAR_DD29144 [Ipomoea batatas]
MRLREATALESLAWYRRRHLSEAEGGDGGESKNRLERKGNKKQYIPSRRGALALTLRALVEILRRVFGGDHSNLEHQVVAAGSDSGDAPPLEESLDADPVELGDTIFPVIFLDPKRCDGSILHASATLCHANTLHAQLDPHRTASRIPQPSLPVAATNANSLLQLLQSVHLLSARTPAEPAAPVLLLF